MFIPGLPPGHTVDVNISSPNPISGNIYKAFCINDKSKKLHQHLCIVRMRMDGVHEVVHTYYGGGGPGSYTEWQCGPGACTSRQDGSVVVDFSVIPPNTAGTDFRPVTELLPHTDAAWAYDHAAYQIPLPPIQVSAIDQVARDAAATAREQARLANSQLSQLNSTIGALKTEDARLASLISKLPSVEDVAKIAWSKAIDYTGTPEFIKNIQTIAQKNLIDAIAYAKKATAKSSHLRDLIETIMKEGNTTSK